MTTDKKNQHYVPKFYLRNFSFQNNQNQIGLFNIVNNKFIDKAKLKTQASKNFYYGTDGNIEDSLSNIEGHLATNIRKVLEDNILPKKLSPEHFELAIFVTLTDLRNPIRINGIKAMEIEMENRLKEVDPDVELKDFMSELTHQEAVTISIGQATHMADMIADLDYKLIINDSNKPFITSDFPVIKYNQFLEVKDIHGSITGYGVTGLQIFLPLNFRNMLFFYDSGIYKLGKKKQKLHVLTDSKDVDNINILQFINCFDTVYFDEKADEDYIKNLFEKSKKYTRANVAKAELSYLFENEDDHKRLETKQKNLIVMNSTDCKTSLKISGLSIHSRGKKHKLSKSMAQLRPHANKLMKKKAANK